MQRLCDDPARSVLALVLDLAPALVATATRPTRDRARPSSCSVGWPSWSCFTVFFALLAAPMGPVGAVWALAAATAGALAG